MQQGLRGRLQQPARHKGRQPHQQQRQHGQAAPQRAARGQRRAHAEHAHAVVQQREGYARGGVAVQPPAGQAPQVGREAVRWALRRDRRSQRGQEPTAWARRPHAQGAHRIRPLSTAQAGAQAVLFSCSLTTTGPCARRPPAPAARRTPAGKQRRGRRARVREHLPHTAQHARHARHDACEGTSLRRAAWPSRPPGRQWSPPSRRTSASGRQAGWGCPPALLSHLATPA